MTTTSTTGDLERSLRERLLLAARVDGDRLMLADGVLLAALDGSRPLTAGERAALQASPLTTRRLRTLALERRTAAHAQAWHASHGMLRAADSGAALELLATDDGYWRLHFVGGCSGSGGGSGSGSGGAWRVILQLLPQAPFAARLLGAAAAVRVLDGGGAEVLAGRLDLDGECEAAWPFDDAPFEHFQRRGARFVVQPGGQPAP